MKKVHFIFVITVLIVGVGVGSAFFYLQSIKNHTYVNVRMGYLVGYRAPWRLAKLYTRKISDIGAYSELSSKYKCNEIPYAKDETVEHYTKECLSRNPAFVADFNDYQKSLTIDTLEFFALTDLSIPDETQYVEKIYPRDPEKGHFILIAPGNSGEFEKESVSKNGKIKKTFYYLPGGTKAYQIDMRAVASPSLPPFLLSVAIPHIARSQFSPKIGTSYLVISTNVQPGTLEEKMFYDVVNSLTFLFNRS